MYAKSRHVAEVLAAVPTQSQCRRDHGPDRQPLLRGAAWRPLALRVQWQWHGATLRDCRGIVFLLGNRWAPAIFARFVTVSRSISINLHDFSIYLHRSSSMS